jgi:predicted aldo/keto reductase-like oxidoreductase
MLYRDLGTTGLKVSEIGIGMEYLAKQSPEIISEVVQSAINRGVTYFDLVFLYPEFLQHFGRIIKNNRNKLVLAGHFGASIQNGKHTKDRSIRGSEKSFRQLLEDLNVDSVELAILQFVGRTEYEKLVTKGTLLNVMRNLQKEGLCKYLGISIHDPEFALQAISSNSFSVIMTQVNLLCGNTSEHLKIFEMYLRQKVGLVAIKPFAGGLLLQAGEKVAIPSYKTGYTQLTFTPPLDITPIKCLSFILSHSAVSCTIPGVKSLAELNVTLAYNDATEEARNYHSVEQYILNLTK